MDNPIFFDFVADDKVKIAYATSFGKDKYIGPEDEKIRTDRNLHRLMVYLLETIFLREYARMNLAFRQNYCQIQFFYAQLRNIMNSLQRHRI